MQEAGSSKKGEKRKRSRQEVRLEVLDLADGTQPPILAYFPTPYDPCKNKEEMSAPELYASAKNQQNAQLVVRTHGNVDYVGHSNQGEAGAWNPTVFALGVFDKEEGTLKIVPALSNKMLRMEPRVRGVSYAMDHGNGKTEELDYATRVARKVNLINRFGTKKSKSSLQKAHRAVVKETALGASDEQFKAFLQDAANAEGLVMTKKEVLEAANAAVVRKIPPYNLEATTPEDAYPLDKMITQEEWDAMDADVVELVKASKKAALVQVLRSEAKYWTYVIDKLPRIRVECDREGNARRVRMLVYLNYLLSMFHAIRGRVVAGRNPDFDEKAQLDIPPVIHDKLNRLFIQVVNKPERGPSKMLYRDFLLSYVLVLMLKVDGYSSDAQEVATYLKVTVTDLKPHYAQIGCKVEAPSRKIGASTGGKVSLPLPLKLENIGDDDKKGGGRGRGRGRK